MEDLADFKRIYHQVKPELGEPVYPKLYKVNRFRRTLALLDHHDEYYIIINNNTLEVEWSHGIEKVLGYSQDPWGIHKSLEIIHDQYQKMYLDLALIFYEVLYNYEMDLSPLKHRYMINYPVKKYNGKYVWIKQMTMPLMLDTNGRMVKQISSYTVVCRYQHGITLPTTPRVFSPDGKRIKEIEDKIFKRYFEKINLRFTPIQIKILKGFLDKEVKKPENEKIDNIQKGLPPVTHKEVSELIKVHEPSVKKHSSAINKKMKEAFNRDFPNTYHIALFLKGMNFFVNGA